MNWGYHLGYRARSLRRPGALGLSNMNRTMSARAVLCLLSLAVGGLLACSPMRTCNASNCNGCCSSTGQCQPGTQASACGRGGSLCKACSGFESCLPTTGSCFIDNSSGGGSSSAGGSAGGGTASTGGGTAATGGGGTSSTGGGSSGVGGGSPNPTSVVGSCFEQWWSDTDGGSRPCAFTASSSPQAVITLDDGGTSTISGSVFADGTFSIANVPAGAVYWFKTGTSWFQTSERNLTLEPRRQGRPDGTLAGAATSLTVSMTGLSPWNNQEHFVSLFSSNVGAELDGFSIGQTAPATGATTFNFLIPYELYSTQLATPMIDSAKGDGLLVTQTRYDPTSGEYRCVGSGEASALTMVSGQTNTTTVALTPPATTSMPLDINVAAFGAHVGDFTPGAAPAMTVNLAHGPRAVHEHAADGWAFAWGSYPPSAATVLPNPVVYPNPFPASWGSSVTVTYGQAVTRLLTGAVEPRRYTSGISVVLSSQQLSSPVVPELSPPREPLINSLVFSMPQSGVTRTPTITWGPPTLGTPSRYSVRVEQLQLSQTTTTARTVGTFYLLPTERSFTVPPNLMITGQSYVIVLSATKTPSPVTSHLFETRLPLTSATVVSGVMRP